MSAPSDAERAKLADIERLIANACGIPKHNSRIAASMIGGLVRDLVEEARAEEREACARIAEDHDAMRVVKLETSLAIYMATVAQIAAAIRGRQP